MLAALAACTAPVNEVLQRKASPSGRFIAVLMYCAHHEADKELVGAVFEQSSGEPDCRDRVGSTIRASFSATAPKGATADAVGVAWVADDRVVFTLDDRVVTSQMHMPGWRELIDIRGGSSGGGRR